MGRVCGLVPPGNGGIPEQPLALELNSTNPIPPSFPKPFGSIFKYAFCRTPLSEEAVEWCSPIGSTNKRCDCTSLAVVFNADETSSFAGADVLLRTLREHLPALEELRFASAIPTTYPWYINVSFRQWPLMTTTDIPCRSRN